MNSIKIKKTRLKELIKGVMQIEKKYSSFFKGDSILDYCDLDIKSNGFSIVFDTRLPNVVLVDIEKIFKNL